MVHLLSVSQLRILSGVLCFISIGAIVAHALVFILLMSHMDAMTVPYSLMGQGVWTGSVTIGTATLLLSYSNAKSKEWIFNKFSHQPRTILCLTVVENSKFYIHLIESLR